MTNKNAGKLAIVALAVCSALSIGAFAQTTEDGQGPTEQPSAPMEVGQGQQPSDSPAAQDQQQSGAQPTEAQPGGPALADADARAASSPHRAPPAKCHVGAHDWSRARPA